MNDPPAPRRPSDRAIDVRLRELAGRDVDQVTAIEAVSNPSPWTRNLFAGEVELDPSVRHWLVAVDGQGAGLVVGFGGLSFVLDTAHLLNLGVEPHHRRRGIARRICVALQAEAAARGITAVTLEVRSGNQAAIALYESLGFEASGLRPGYYPDGEDAMIFWNRPFGPHRAVYP